MKLRAFVYKDCDALAQMICATWNSFHFMSSYEQALQKAKAYLFDCLQHATFAFVLEEEQTIIGCMIGNRHNAQKAKQRMLYEQQDSTMITKEEWTRFQRSHTAYQAVCKEMLMKTKKKYQAELLLFVIKPEYRKKGYGKEIFMKTMDYLVEEGCSKFYLYTDSTCDYSFYDHFHMKCVDEKSLHQGMRKNGFRIFLYEGDSSFIKYRKQRKQVIDTYTTKEYCQC